MAMLRHEDVVSLKASTLRPSSLFASGRSLSENHLTTLPEGIFGGLTSLAEL